jgi:hypothetical protein
VHRRWSRASLASRSLDRRLRPCRPPGPTRSRRWCVGPLQQPSPCFTSPQNTLKLPAPLNWTAHPNSDLLARESIKIGGLFECPIHPWGRHLEAREINPLDFQHPHQLSTGGFAIFNGRPQGLTGPINKNAQETPSNELEIDKFIAQACERLFNDLL